MTAPFVADADFVLYQGDARAVLAELEPESVHCVVTSPPYYLLRDYEHEGQIGLEATLDEYVAAIVDVFRGVRRVLRSDGVVWLNVGDTHCGAPRGPRHGKTSKLSTPERQEKVSTVVDKRGRADGVKPKDLFAVPFELALALRTDGWWLRQTVIWDKYVFLLARSARYFYDGAAIAEPATWDRWGTQSMKKDVVGPCVLRRSRLDRRGISPVGRRAARRARPLRDARELVLELLLRQPLRERRLAVWRMNCAQFGGEHAAVMPDELAERCIRAGCPEGGVVLDPFAGAGTTALAARRLGRRSIGIELSATSCSIAAERLSQLSLLAEADAA